jgi:hypothetical protein
MKQNSMAPGRRTNRLSSSILRITRSGPKETNFAIVDVPGLVRGRCVSSVKLAMLTSNRQRNKHGTRDS